ncbi:MAG TPA: hypothetical protein VES79_03470 [Solirubrobacteraceae bacterium]|nr:hypothetical protein [Solirubrobacteraceae bacterium]
MNDHHDLQPDLQPVVDQLRAHRPEATALELDAIKQQVRTRVSQPARRRTRRAELMKSRLVILSTLVLGLLLSTAGAGLAVSGLSGNDNASVAQYGPTTAAPPSSNTTTTPPPSSNTTTPPPSSNTVLGEQDQGEGSQNVLPEEDAGGNAPGSGVQPARQVETGATPSSGNQLPFTGFAAMPILLLGIALLTVGLVLRRRTAGEN